MIAIHDSPGGFSDRWRDYCYLNSLPFINVDIFDTNLLRILKEHNVEAVLLHPPMYSSASEIATKSIVHALNLAGLLVFPSPDEIWHFDDKIAQKYLFDAIDAPTARTDVFFTREAAEEFAATCEYPVVLKLKQGAGSINVALCKNRSDANREIRKLFGKGITPASSARKDILNKVRRHKSNRDWIQTLARLPRTLLTMLSLERKLNRERGYIYFQAFIPRNEFDIRVTIIGKKAFGFRRLVRPNDFRASGSNNIDYDPNGIALDFVESAFDLARKIGTRCIAIDFVSDPDTGKPVLLEISYAFNSHAVRKCPGYWDEDLIWRSGQQFPEDLILEAILVELERRKEVANTR